MIKLKIRNGGEELWSYDVPLHITDAFVQMVLALQKGDILLWEDRRFVVQYKRLSCSPSRADIILSIYVTHA